MTDTKLVEMSDAEIKAAEVLWQFICDDAPNMHIGTLNRAVHETISAYLAALSHPASDVPGAEEVEQIRARLTDIDRPLNAHELLGDASKLLVSLDAARAELAEVREALKPFANAGRWYGESEEHHKFGMITVGDLRRARAALAKDAT